MSFVQVGKIKDAHGIRGELFVVLFAGEAAWLPKLTQLRLVPAAPGPGVPASASAAAEPRTFTVKSARAHKNGLIVKSSDITDRNLAESLKGLIVEIPEEFLVSQPGESIYLREILGFTVLNNGEELGRVVKFSSNGAQDLLIVSLGAPHAASEENEVEIPFVEAFVEKINYASKTIRMSLPPGLIDLDAAATDERDGQSDDQGADQSDDQSAEPRDDEADHIAEAIDEA